MFEKVLSRRRVLKAASGSVAPLGASGVTAAKPDETVEVNVGVGSNRGRAAARRAASEVVRDFDSLRIVTIRAPQRAVDALARREDVRYVEPNGTYRALGETPSNQRSDEPHLTSLGETLPWGIDRVDADVARANGFEGTGSHVGIIDTGIDDDHSDLAANVGAGKAFVSCAGSNCNYDWSDDNGHGTHCAGIASAEDDAEGTVGVGAAATLHAVKVLDDGGYGSYSDIAAGIEYVADQGWHVGSLSLGGSTSSLALKDACSYARNEGVLLVAAAGNDGPCSDCVNYPAKYPECVAVSATTETDALADFSSTGSAVELAAPGAGVYSTVVGGYARKDGTSMACPHVSGAAGLLAARGLTSDRIRDRLRATAEDVGLSSHEQGHGLLNAEAAAPVGERGTLSFDQPDRGTWFTEALDREYRDAVVVVSPLSYSGHDPSHVRVCAVRDVDDASFRYQIEEWDYDDGSHVEETAHFAVFDAGTYRASSGTQAEVATVSTDEDFASVAFSREFAERPVVFTQAQTRNGQQAIVTRTRQVSTGGFEVALEEEEAKGPHRTETVGYVALSPGVGRLAGTTLEVGRTGDAVDDSWHRIDFSRSYDSPRFVAGLQTYHGSNTAELRYRNLTADSVAVKVEEEGSADDETNHATEVVGYAVAEGAGLI